MSAARRLAGAARRRAVLAIERLLHPLRRRRAIARVRRTQPRPRRFLVICHGNVCRSPYLAAILERDLPRAVGEEVMVVSAGFVGPGRGVPPNSAAVASKRGLDLSAHRSQLVSVPLVVAADLVLVMDVHQARAVSRTFGRPADRVLVVGDLDPQPIDGRTIRDPWNQDVDVFAQSFDRIERCAAELARVLADR